MFRAQNEKKKKNREGERGMMTQAKKLFGVFACLPPPNIHIIIVLGTPCHQSTGMTSYQILRGNHYRGEIAMIREDVWARVPGERWLEADAQWRRGI